MQERTSASGTAGLTLSLPFDELAALEASRPYLLRTLDLQEIHVTASKSEEDNALPGEPAYHLS